MATVHVVTSDGALKRALLAKLERIPGLDLFTRDGMTALQPKDIVVATTTDCPTERVAELAASGVRVIILAAVPRTTDSDRYRQAGAEAYIPMAVDTTQLVDAIQQAAGLA